MSRELIDRLIALENLCCEEDSSAILEAADAIEFLQVELISADFQYEGWIKEKTSLLEQIEIMHAALLGARRVFSSYAEIHAAKNPPDFTKSMYNQAMADKCYAAIGEKEMAITTHYGTLTFSHPDTDEEYEIEYKAVYEPATYHNPGFSELFVIDLPTELEPLHEKIFDLCWVNFHESRFE